MHAKSAAAHAEVNDGAGSGVQPLQAVAAGDLGFHADQPLAGEPLAAQA